MISAVMPFAKSDSKKAATLPTSSIVTLRRSGAVCSTASNIFPNPLIHYRNNRLSMPFFHVPMIYMAYYIAPLLPEIHSFLH